MCTLRTNSIKPLPREELQSTNKTSTRPMRQTSLRSQELTLGRPLLWAVKVKAEGWGMRIQKSSRINDSKQTSQKGSLRRGCPTRKMKGLSCRGETPSTKRFSSLNMRRAPNLWFKAATHISSLVMRSTDLISSLRLALCWTLRIWKRRSLRLNLIISSKIASPQVGDLKIGRIALHDLKLLRPSRSLKLMSKRILK